MEQKTIQGNGVEAVAIVLLRNEVALAESKYQEMVGIKIGLLW